MELRNTALRAAALGLAASSLAMAAGGPAGAVEAKPGIGTATVSTTILDVRLGQLLGLKLLEDTGRSTTDPKVGVTGAVASLTPLSLSSTVKELNVGALKAMTVSSPGTPSSATGELIDLGQLGGASQQLKALPVPLPALVTGKVLPATLSALHQPASATTSAAKVVDLGLLGGLAKVGSISSTDATGSGTAAAEASRATVVDAISVLDLGQLLAGLGIDILDLPLSVVSQLLTTLGVPVDLQGATDLASLVKSIQGSIDTLLQSTSATVTAPVVQTLTAVDGLVKLPVTLAPAVQTTVDTAVQTLRDQLAQLLGTVVDLLEQATVLKVSALELSTLAKATGSASTSVADAKAKVGGLQVGATTIPGLDVTATAAQVNALVKSVEGALNAALAPIGVKDLVQVRLFEEKSGVSQADGYIKAISSISALSVKVTPPAQLATIVNGLTGSGATSIGSLVPALGTAGAADAKAAALPEPLAGLVSGVGSLTQGLSLSVGVVESAAEHAVPATPISQVPVAQAPPTDLPRTGGESAPLAIGALGLGALALAGRRLSRRTTA